MRCAHLRALIYLGPFCSLACSSAHHLSPTAKIHGSGPRRLYTALDFSLPRSPIDAKPVRMCSLSLGLCRSRFPQQLVYPQSTERTIARGVVAWPTDSYSFPAGLGFFLRQLVHTQSTISTDWTNVLLSHTTSTEAT